jgi:hypothetical protein
VIASDGLVRFVVSVGILLSGCFYIDPLNDPPVLQTSCELPDGRACGPGKTVHLGERIELHMTVDDPDENHDPGSHHWHAAACVDSAATGACKDMGREGDLRSGVAIFDVPADLVNVCSIFVRFTASDVLGATGSDFIVLLVDDAPVQAPCLLPRARPAMVSWR